MSKRLGRFELGEQIDAGGFTTVYRAVEDMGQGITRPAAVKVMTSWNLDDEDQLARLRHEVEVLVELGGAPNIVSILAMGIDDEMGAWIAMELAGRSLAHSITEGPVEPDQVRVLLRDTLRALVSVHGGPSQILHRDLKPQNILGSQGSWMVTDFGLAKRRGADETMSLATVKYAAPELLDATLGEESPRLDVYALGMVAYEFALGHELFRKQFPSIYDPTGGSKQADGDDRPKWMYWHTSQQMSLPPIAELVEGYPQDLSDLIAAMTAKPVEQRIASADEALRRLGEVGAISVRHEQEDEEQEDDSRSISPVIAISAAIAIVIAMVGGLMWYLLEGRPSIAFDGEGQFTGPAEVIRVTGMVENYPEAGRAEIQLRRGSVRSFPVALQAGGKFTCDVRVRAVGSFPALMVVKDRSGARVARASLELERVVPTSVQIELATSPVVPGATVMVRGSGGEDAPVTLTTDTNGRVSTSVPYGEFALEVFHPRYRPLPLRTVQTGIDLTWSRTVNLVELDYAVLRAEMQREVDRLMRLMGRKTTCPPGPLTPAEEEQVLASVKRLRQLGDGDEDIELFLESISRVQDCDQSTMVTAPELPPPPVGEVAPGEQGPDPALAINRVIARIERLIERKVTCPPGPLSPFEEDVLARALDELAGLALGNIDVELYIDSARRVKDCDPSSRPAEVPTQTTREERAEDERGRQEQQRLEQLADVGADPGEEEPSKDTQDPGKLADEVGDEVKKFLEDNGLGAPPRKDEGGSKPGGPTPESIVDDVLSRLPANPALVDKLMNMPMEEFVAFVQSNVPTGAIAVEPLIEVDMVRLRGALFRSQELERMALRLGYAMGRLQLEVRLDAWEVARGLSSALTGIDAAGVQVDAYLVSKDPTLFVQFEQDGSFDPARADALASTFVIDQGLLWVRAYVEQPAGEPDRDEERGASEGSQ